MEATLLATLFLPEFLQFSHYSSYNTVLTIQVITSLEKGKVISQAESQIMKIKKKGIWKTTVAIMKCLLINSLNKYFTMGQMYTRCLWQRETDGV